MLLKLSPAHGSTAVSRAIKLVYVPRSWFDIVTSVIEVDDFYSLFSQDLLKQVIGNMTCFLLRLGLGFGIIFLLKHLLIPFY